MPRILRALLVCLVVPGTPYIDTRSGYGFTTAGAPVHEFMFVEGHKHYNEGDLAGAEKLWAGIRSDELYGPVTALLLAKGHLSRGDTEKAARLLKTFLDNQPPEEYVDLARTLLVEALCKARSLDAVPLLDTMIKTCAEGDRPRLIYTLARLYRQAGNQKKAAEHYRTLFVNHPASVEGLKASDDLAWMVVHGKIPKLTLSELEQLARARRLFQEGRFDLAAESYGFLLKEQPSNVSFLLKLATCRFKDRKNRDAIKTLNAILQKKISLSERMEALYLLSRAYWRLERNAEFERCCREIMEKASPALKHKVLFNQGAHYYERGKFSAALNSFNRLINSPISDSMKADVTWKIGWIYYRTGKYADAAEAFRRARSTSQNGRMAGPSRYWQARCLMHLGKPTEAKVLLSQIVSNSPLDYYGQRAALSLKSMGAEPEGNRNRSRFPDTALSPSHLEMKQVAAAKRLMDVELYELALASLSTLPGAVKASPPVALLMARAAYGAKQYKKARDILGTAFAPFMDNPPDDAPPELVEIAFPRVHRKATIHAANAYGVDPHLVWAVVRQESMYDASAVSPAGALGLMQVTPKAAGLVSKRGRIPADAIEKILEPEENLAAGIRILSKNLGSFKGKMVPAVASYNADIRKVRDWVRRNGAMAEDEFVENIPYFETRMYVKKVLAGYGAYTILHKKFDLAGLW